MVDERTLAERLMTYDTSRAEELAAAAGFVRGWLEAREIEVREHTHNGLPVIVAEVGPEESPPAPTVIFHSHLDVVPGFQEQFEPRVDGDRLIGRGAYDMKGGLAAMMWAVKDCAAQDRVRVKFLCVPDEEAEDVDQRATDELIGAGLAGDFAITGEPTNLHIGIEAKGVLAMRIEVTGRSAHGSTPWLGDSAVLKAIDIFRRIEALPFARESSELFDCPSINLGRIAGGDVFNRVPDLCTMVVDVRYLPGQDPGAILAAVRAMDDVTVTRTLTRQPAYVARSNPYVRALRDAIARTLQDEAVSIGRDGASDAVSFQAVGIPAVEFGPSGGGHHGPDEWVSIASLQRYRRALGHFVRTLPEWLARDRANGPAGLQSLEGAEPLGLRPRVPSEELARGARSSGEEVTP
jgi:succinyl-diaminopimelate desuccinylase